jgi:hypothetical protein
LIPIKYLSGTTTTQGNREEGDAYSETKRGTLVLANQHYVSMRVLSVQVNEVPRLRYTTTNFPMVVLRLTTPAGEAASATWGSGRAVSPIPRLGQEWGTRTLAWGDDMLLGDAIPWSVSSATIKLHVLQTKRESGVYRTIKATMDIIPAAKTMTALAGAVSTVSRLEAYIGGDVDGIRQVTTFDNDLLVRAPSSGLRQGVYVMFSSASAEVVRRAAGMSERIAWNNKDLTPLAQDPADLALSDKRLSFMVIRIDVVTARYPSLREAHNSASSWKSSLESVIEDARALVSTDYGSDSGSLQHDRQSIEQSYGAFRSGLEADLGIFSSERRRLLREVSSFKGNAIAVASRSGTAEQKQKVEEVLASLEPESEPLQSIGRAVTNVARIPGELLKSVAEQF